MNVYRRRARGTVPSLQAYMREHVIGLGPRRTRDEIRREWREPPYHSPLSRMAWELRHSLSYDEALYVALATSLGVPLLTADGRLAGAPDLPCEVDLVVPTRPTG